MAELHPWPKVAGRPEVPEPKRIVRPCDYGLFNAIRGLETQLGTIEAYNRLAEAAHALKAQIDAGNAKPQHPMFAVSTGAVRMNRRTWTTDELREMEKQLAKPPPYPPFLIDNLRAALVYAADLIDAADAAIKQEREAAVAICEALKDPAEEAKALAKFRAAEGKGTSEALARGQHWSAVSLYNAGLNNAAVAIRARSEQGKLSTSMDV